MKGTAAETQHAGQQVLLSFGVGRDADRPAHPTDPELAEDLGEGEVFFVGGDVARNRRAVLAAVLLVAVGGEAEGTRLHALVEELLHVIELFLGDGSPVAGLDHAEDVAAEGGEGQEGADVDAEALAVEAVEVLGVGLPVPAHAGAHGFEGDGLDAVHHPHVEVAVFGAGGRKAEAALADADGRLAEPAVEGGVGVPIQLRVVVGVQVDGAGGDDTAARVDLLGSARGNAAADLGDLAVLDADVGGVAGNARRLDHRAASNHHVILSQLGDLLRLCPQPVSRVRG